MLPTLVNAGDLAQWANRLDAPGYLPKLVRSLILATVDDITRLDMRSGEGTRYPGYDGIVEVGGENVFVPTGLSVWEMGVDRDPKGKADGDYNKRTYEDSLGVDPAQATFVFVTPRRWAGKEAWADSQRETGSWRDIRVIDADDLEAWLELAPVVYAWLSQLLGKDPGDIQDFETYWIDWREATRPPLSAALIISGRDDAAERIVQHLQTQPSALTVRADSQDEALAFIAAAFEQLSAAERNDLFAHTLVVNNSSAWRQITITERPLILLPTFAPVEVVQVTRRGHHVLIPAGREIAESKGMELLQRPSRQAAEAALQAMGFGQARASTLASVARRSLLSLRRTLSLNPEVQQPAWAAPEKARAILPVVLAGGWDEAVEGDRDAVVALAGRPYEEVAEDLVRYANESDPPVRQVGTTWFLASKEDAWRLLMRFLTRHSLERFRRVTCDVLGALDPALELPPDQQWMASAMGRPRPHSNILREGLADTLALMAARTGDELLGGTATGQGQATTIVAQLLQRANEDLTGRIWHSLSDILPLLAEAAPASFLSAIDKATAGSDPIILKVFTDQMGDFLATRSGHTHLLRALERLAWSPDYLGSAALSLARLARLDPGGRLANRPGHSLRGIFLSWWPQTAAPFEQRLQVLDMLREQEPAQAWKLMLSLLPTLHESADPANAPQWRDWKPEEHEPSFSDVELLSATEALVKRLLSDVGIDCSRIGDLIERIGNLPPPSRTLMLDFLESLDPSPLDDGSREALWAKLREQVSSHRRFASARWAMPSEDVDRLAAIYERFAPEELVRKAAWLFTDWPRLPDAVESDNFRRPDTAIYEAQVSAAQQVYQSEGLAGLFALTKAVEQPWILGWVLSKSGLVEQDENRLLDKLGSSDVRYRQVARGFVEGSFQAHGWEWADRKVGANGPQMTPSQRADFFLSLPSRAETWDRIEQCDDDTVNLFWIQLFPRVEDPADCLRAAGQLLAHGRAWQAIDLLALYLEKVAPSVEIVLNVIETAIYTPPGDSINQSLLYEISQIFNYLEQAEGVDEGRLAQVEWALLPLFKFEQRPLKILHRQLAIDPAFFVEVVSTAYRATDEEPRELGERDRASAQAAYYLLRSASIVPGTQGDGTIDPAKLLEWVSEARQLLEESKRLEIGDQCIGRVLHHAKRDKDELWPPQAIRDLLEKLRSDDIELGLEVAERNARGVTWRSPTAGGEQERQIMARYLAQAQKVHLKWPRTARMLRRIAQAYASEASMNDRNAELREDRW